MTTPYDVHLALDPGGTTGYCGVVHWEKPKVGELTGAAHYLALWKLLQTWADHATRMQGNLIIICEPFEFRQEDSESRPKIDYSPARYEGVVDFFVRARPRLGHRRVILLKQSSSLIGKKSFWGDDDKIKQIGLWKPGMPHGMDALRHYLYYMTFTRSDHRYLQKLR